MSAYKEQSDPDLIEDIHARKEFAQLWAPSHESKHDVASQDLQSHQQFVRNFMNPNTPNMRMHLMHSTGCHAPGTKILRARNGANIHGVCNVEDIMIGDVLVNPNGADTRVRELHRGFGQMFRITTHGIANAQSYVVNAQHILRLYTHNWVARDITVQDYYERAREQERMCEKEGACARKRMIQEFEPLFLGYIRAQNSCVLAPFDITAERDGPYFGFTLDCDECSAEDRALFLGADGLILHNSGKTRAAIAAAQECVKMYRFIYRNVNWRDPAIITPSIFVIAFGGKHAFIRDLIKYPEFGYASVAEYETYMRLYRESVENDSAYQKYVDFYSSLKRRATNRAKGGYYKMLGYDEFANRLFGSDVEKLNGIIQSAHAKREPYATALERAIQSGEIKPDPVLLARLENSMIIADEIHNTYNSQSINNRGLALQYVLDHVKGVRFLSLSATPINSSPAEICDFINYFVARDEKIMRDSLFAGYELLPGAIETINNLLRGHISFLYDFDPHFFPKRIDCGVPLELNGATLPYLKFTPCAMSEYFTQTIRDFYLKRANSAERNPANNAREIEPACDTEEIDVSERDDLVIGITQNAYSLFDMVFPNPNSETTGLYDSATVFGTIHGASDAWKKEVGISTKTSAGIHIFSGPFMQRANLAKYSAKYATMINEILSAIRETGPCKIMIYHERVRLTGVILIREILRENGCIDEHDEPTNTTICAACAKSRIEHAHEEHAFRPLRFVAMYSELDKTALNSIRDKYNSAANTRGEWCSILIGSKLIRESYDFASVRHLFVLSLPISITQLIQVFGRCVRRASHVRLPENERDVKIHILVNSQAPSSQQTANDMPEVRRYALKLNSYLVIQKIERELARNAVDAGIHRNIITIPERDSLGLLLYDEAHRFTLDMQNMHVDTFFAYGYGAQEIHHTIDIIKRLFKIKNMWSMAELIKAIHMPPFATWANPALISDSSIQIALAFLVAANDGATSADRLITIGRAQFIVVAGILDKASSGEDDNQYFFLTPIETVEIAGITRSRPMIDIESFIRGAQYETEEVISIDQFELRASFEAGILGVLRAEFATRETTANSAHKISARQMARMRPFLVRFSTDQQRTIAQHIVEHEEFRTEFADLYAFMKALGIFVPFGYASKYRDVMRRFDQQFASVADAADPVAFGDGASVRLFTGTEWIALGRSSLNMHIEFNEAGELIGIFRQFPYSVKFQLREPIQTLRAHRLSGQHHDARTIERGSVCTSRARKLIERDAQRVGIPLRDLRAAETVSDLCDMVQRELVAKEIVARGTPHSLDKYVYGWWNAIPTF